MSKTNFTLSQQGAYAFNEGKAVVSASAGSGKTFVMISRILRLILEKKTEVKNVLCVTFTTLAADEMRQRLISALMEELQNDENNEYLIKQLNDISLASISTLHSLCSDILRTYYYRLGIDSAFKVLDENEANSLKEDALDELFEELYLSGDEEFLYLSDIFVKKRKDNAFKNIIKRAYATYTSNFIDREDYEKSFEIYTDEGFDFISEKLFSFAKETYAHYREKFVSLKEEFTTLGEEKNKNACDYLIEYIDRSVNSPNYFVFLNQEFKNPTVAKVKEGNEDYKDEFKSLKGEFKEERDKLFKDIVADAKTEKQKLFSSKKTAIALANLIFKYEEKYGEQKRNAGGLDFADLERFTIKLLRENEDIVLALKQKYKYAFVDEFQDTNKVQDAILSFIANENLFIVGDIKQSIYAFRGCDPEIFACKQEEIKSGETFGVNFVINENFRCADKVIQATNNLFDYAMTKDSCGVSYKDEARLISGGLYVTEDKECKGEAVLHLIQNEDKEKKKLEVYDIEKHLEDLRQDEYKSEHVLISKIIDEKFGSEYYDIKSKSFKKIDFKDIVILTRSQDEFAQNLVDYLMLSSIPVSAEIKKGVVTYVEIKLLIDILKLLDNENQDLPLVALLKSPIGNLTLEELTEIRLTDKKSSFYSLCKKYAKEKENEIALKLKVFYDFLTKYRFKADFLGAGEILREIINEYHLEAYYSLFVNGKGCLERMNRFLCESVVNGKRLSVREFLDRIDKNGSNFSSMDASGENSVKIMTIHSSKGLEFPVVIMCSLKKAFNFKDNNENVLFDKKHGFITYDYNLDKRTFSQTILRKYVREEYKFSASREEMRVLYVGMTRAKYSLHMIVSGAEIKVNPPCEYDVKRANSFAKVLYKGMCECKSYKEEELEVLGRERSKRKVFVGETDEEFFGDLDKNLSFEYENKEGVFLPLKSTVTKINGVGNDETDYVYDLSVDTSKEKGTLYHKVLEHIDLTLKSEDEINSQLDKLLRSGVLSQEERDGINVKLVLDTLKNDVFSDISGSKIYKEKSFFVMMPVSQVFGANSKDEVLVQGIIDLLIVDGDKATIVDYKLTKMTRDEDIVSKYKLQLSCYKYAVEKALGLNVDKLSIINLSNAKEIKIEG